MSIQVWSTLETKNVFYMNSIRVCDLHNNGDLPRSACITTMKQFTLLKWQVTRETVLYEVRAEAKEIFHAIKVASNKGNRSL